MNGTYRFLGSCCGWLFLLLMTLPTRAATETPGLLVVSANVRFGTAEDGENRWDQRREWVAESLKSLSADLIGTQEMLPFQAEYLSQQLDGYTYVGRSRELDNPDGEQCGVFFRSSRFVLMGVSYFWLSETPEQPGSQSWDAALPRMVTQLKLFDRKSNRVFVCFNTHFDHRGREARAQSARLLRRYAEATAAKYPTVVTGDFNAAESSEPYQALVAAGPDGGSSPLVDTYRQMHPETTDNEGTFNGFQGRSNGPRIDWILASSDWKINAARIIRDAKDGKYPSDHFFVVAELQWPAP